mgnify:CR=1 FL=1
MKKFIILLFAVLFTGLIFWSCSDDSSSEPEKDTTAPTISLTYPANNAEFTEGTTVTIKADATDNETVAKVEFYVDGDLVGTDETSPYQLSWATTGKVGSHTIMAKAYDASENTSSSETINFVVKEQPSIILTSPNGGENWQMGTTQTITWTDNLSENVKIDLYKGGSLNSAIISSVTTSGSYTWSIPSTLTSGTDYRVRITGVTTTTLYDESNANFTISAVPTISVSSPNGSESWQMGSSQSIKWTDNISENVKIDLYKAGDFNSTISNTTSSDGSYSWTIPTILTAGTDYKIRISGVTTTTLYDESNANFTITEIPNITVTSPNGGETWYEGYPYTITWTDNIDENVKIELYNSSSLILTIDNTTESDGEYIWSIPTTMTNSSYYKIKISSINTSTIYDYSNANFKITDLPGISITNPTNGSTFFKEAIHTITWSDNMSENVRIDLYKDLSFIDTISTSTPSDGKFDWNIPSTLPVGSNYNIKITSIIASFVNTFSDDFNIADDYIITFPDYNLESRVREVINKPTEDIFISDVSSIKEFEALGLGIVNISGLEHFLSLEILDLSYKYVSGTTYYNEIVDISSLSNLQNLMELDLSGNKISNISPLSSLPVLQRLLISDNMISNISSLQNFSYTLTELYLSSNPISDISILSNMSNLLTLWIDDILERDFSKISSLVNLEDFNASRNEISNIAFLSNLVNLRWIWLGSNNISDISVLSNLTSTLNGINLGYNNITDISVLSHVSFKVPWWLWLDGNSITDIYPLVQNSTIENGVIWVRSNPLSSLSIDSYIPTLKSRGNVVN